MEPITVQTLINASIEKVWDAWTNPNHIINWCFASDDWCAPHATNDVRAGGTFTTRMESRDGSVGFDFGGTYTNVVEHELIEYTIGDGRHVSVKFISENGGVTIRETFDPESQNPVDMQRAGWQAILDNFKKYAENLK